MTVTDGPFGDVRVLEVSQGQAARMAGMLLADLGAEVVRILPAGAVPGQDAEGLAWDRGKRLSALRPRASGERELASLAAGADVVLSDAPWDAAGLYAGSGTAAALGLVRGQGPGLVRVWMPPYAPFGRFAGLPDDPVLRAALGGFAAHHPSAGNQPVASVVPVYTAVHAALGAAAAAAGLLRARAPGSYGDPAGDPGDTPFAPRGDTVVVSGLHAMAACLCPMAITGLDVAEVHSAGSTLPGPPNFRTYPAGDGRWLYLAALSPDLFFRALTVLDRVDVMLLDGVEGEFTNVLIPAIGAGVGAELEKTFATRPRAQWLAELAAAGIPAAPVATREDWLAGSFHDGLITLPHPVHGTVTMPGVPVRLSATPGRVRHLPSARRVVPAADAWPGRVPRPRGAPDARPLSDAPPPPAGRPLAGLRVVDLSSFLAAPFVSTLLADFGASVVKVERPGGDPYRVFTASFAAVNQGKTVGTLDIRDPAGRDALLEVLGDADVLVDNMPAMAMERLGLGDQDLAAINPALIRCSVSAFGRTGAHAGLPGFDPVLQALSGLAAAQGGADDQPVTTSAPVHDVATGALGALGVLAALCARARGGGPGGGRVEGRLDGQHVTVSLAATAGFLQLAEMTRFPGRAPTARGGRDFPGPEPVRRIYRARDGWLAVAAASGEQAAALLAVTGTADPAGAAVPDGLAGALSDAFANRPVAQWLDILAEFRVPACPVIARDRALWDPMLDADLTHIVRDPRIGRLRVIRGYADWAGAPDAPPGEDWQRRVAARLASAGTLAAPFMAV